MPSFNLRLTEEEHAQLKQEAWEAHRSIQREIIHRLFVEMPVMAMKLDGPELFDLAVEPHADEIEEHFRPDFGPKLRR